ncbi:MAG: histidine phosphatase family protein [Leptolyngbyaceae cyanobacterium T60_A2020_046]|nr:histidine phosphatase family protein [Leptolyngbyaceae cyanobacterium T60_A2020_046]
MRSRFKVGLGGAIAAVLVGCSTPISLEAADSLAVAGLDAPFATLPNEPVSVTVTTAPSLSEAGLWERLQQPETAAYVVLVRHAIAPGTGDPASFWVADCSTQRNLSAEGRSQAQQIGQAFRDRGVSVRRVASSQWCRWLDTARLMALGSVEPLPVLNSFFRDRSTAEAQTTELKALLAAEARTPGVLVMVTHQVNITALTDTALTDIVPRSGEAVVLAIEPDQLTLLGRLTPR